MRWLSLLASGAAGWFGLPDSSAALPCFDLLAPLHAHYDSLPWLPWAAWLLGMALLLVPRLDAPAWPAEEPDRNARVLRFAFPALLLLLILLVGGYARMSQLWPQDRGLTQLPFDDEGVYAGASQLFLQGILPYRDYFFAHPPVAAFSYAPAMAYHFTEWGSPTSFMIARYLSVAYSLLTLALLFPIGWNLAGPCGGLLASALWALDGRVVEINRKVMLDGPMVLLSCAALLLYLSSRSTPQGRQGNRRTLLLLAAAGAFAALSALTKLAGVACLFAILADLLWSRFDARRSPAPHSPLAPRLLALLAGTLATSLLAAGPFFLAAPSAFLRQVLFFQLLRPSDGLVDVPSRISDISATFANALTPLFAALGLAAASLWLGRRRTDDEGRTTNDRGPEPKDDKASKAKAVTATPSASVVPHPAQPWRLVALWTFFSLLLFTYTRSFYGHYYIQLAAPLCLLGSGVSFIPALVGSLAGRVATRRRIAAALSLALLLFVSLPLLLVQWRGATRGNADPIFAVVARYVNNAVPPGAEVLTTDEQFNFLASRPPSSGPTGYLVDSYGQLIYLGLGLHTRDLGDLVSSALRGENGGDNPDPIMQRAVPQADLLQRALAARMVVIHDKGERRFTPATLRSIEDGTQVAERQRRYTIYRSSNPGE